MSKELIFIIGGGEDGQEQYARVHYPGAEIIGDYHLAVKGQLERGEDPAAEAERLLEEHGVCGTAQSAEEEAARNIQDGEEPGMMWGTACLVIWSCEIGCGLVPVDPEERRWREASGRVNGFFAEKASCVIRMVCGVGTVLKGWEGMPQPSRGEPQEYPAQPSRGEPPRRSGIQSRAETIRSSSERPRGRARAIMVAGTMSNAGKSFLAAGLCRIFTEDGYRVAPFKAQNMALNSFITKNGEEMGRAQAVQAEACRKAPDVRMNPILLKPTTDKGSQVIVLGAPAAEMDAREYYRHKSDFLPVIREAYDSLARENDIIVLEGAGSPAEINLMEHDIVNLPMAAYAGAPVLLVGNIDPGGVFAQLYGTVKLLGEEEQAQIAGLIINQFRGDPSILEPGLSMLEERTGKRVLGVVPYMDVTLEPEDSLAMRETPLRETSLGAASCSGKLNGEARNREILNEEPPYRDLPPGEEAGVEIAVIRFPRISNFTDFEAFLLEEDVRIRYVKGREELGTPDAIILPGTKSTISDLLWMRQNGLETAVRRAHAGGTFIMGICGGYQMLGKQILDPQGIERKGEAQGMGLLDMVTVFGPEKVMRQVTGVSAFGIPMLDGKKMTGYEVHMGREESRNSAPEDRKAGDQGVAGTYIHGLFDEEEFREAFLEYLYKRKGMSRQERGRMAAKRYRDFKEEQLEHLAAVLRESLDMPAIYDILGPAGREAEE